MYTTNQVDIKSFFSVGGIHGLPYQTWDDARGDPDPEPDQWLGYCTHGSVLFPTWHRPYVLLYEVCSTSSLAVLVIDGLFY